MKNHLILVTKSRLEVKNSLMKLINEGAELIFFPTIKIKPIYGTEVIDELMSESLKYDFIVFTSANAVKIFAKILADYKLDLSRTKIAVVGKATAEECRANGIYIHIIPEEFSAKGLIKKFSQFGIDNKKILIPGSALSREELKLGLTELGAEVINLPIYDVVVNDLSELEDEYKIITSRKPDVFIFTSPSSFENYLKLMNINDPVDYFTNVTICAIGPTTESEIKSNQINVNIVPKIYTLEGVADAIIEYFNLTKNLV